VIRPFDLLRRMRVAVASVLLLSATGSYALNTATIVGSVASPDCLEYRVVGICYWLYCTWTGCTVRTSVKVRHYIPDAVVSSYSNTGENPWIEVRAMSTPNPGVEVFNQFVSSSGYFCEGAGTAFMPYLLSTLDTLAWRYNVPEMAFPEALIPGMREVGARSTLNLWGNVYPRGGFLHQTDDHKAGAVVAQRAGDVVTRRGQIHVYQPLLANSRPGYWPAGALMEGDASTGKWQELTPVLSSSCTVFPRSGFLTQAQQGDYAWALWRPYACCERRGQVFLGSVDFY